MKPTIGISGIRFPKQIIDALSHDRLVVFAGAGVSAAAPACLPGFGALAKAIARGSGEGIGDDEPEDQFLGRLHHRGQRVHERAKEEILSRNSRPTALHRSLLQLFGEQSAVRLVTTNFDTLFEDAAEKLFETAPAIYSAPALPLGSEFSGIIHVHGSTEHEQDMVLTDSDFGRAYLTEGWARRFLVEMFRSYSILFVGYSHNDTVMRYLARALPTETRRFALTPESEVDRWRIFNISAIAYSMPGDDDHRALNEGISGLVTHVSRGVFDWQRDIHEIASRPPPPDEETSDLIFETLSEPARIHFFTDAAHHSEWIDWLDDHGLLSDLFETGSGLLKDVDLRLANWLADRFAFVHPVDLMNFLSKHSLHLHPSFWHILANKVGLEQEETLPRDTLSRWVSLLLASAPSLSQYPWTSSTLSHLGERCADANLPDSLIEIFTQMVSIDLTVRSLLPFMRAEGLDDSLALLPTVETGVDHLGLSDLWTKKLKPRIDELAETLLEVTVQALEAQHRTLVAWQSDDSLWDAASSGRSAIEPHGQDDFPEPTDAVIDIARDCLEYLASERPVVALHWCEILVRKNAHLLRRLAVHTLPRRNDLSADEKAEWLIAKVGLHNLSTRHETFQAMRSIYPETTPSVRRKIIDAIRSSEWPVDDDEEREQLTAYTQFNWGNWLLKSDPECELLGQLLANVNAKYPDFQVWDHPDFNVYTTSAGPVPIQSPWSASELKARSAGEWIDDLISFQGDGPFRADRDGLLAEIEEVATQDAGWGFELAAGLAASGYWETDIWLPLMRAWSRELAVEQHREVLAWISQWKLYSQHTRDVSNFLCFLVRRDGPSYSADLLPESNGLAGKIWDYVTQNPLPVNPGNRLFQAVNHPAGSLAQFWLSSLEISMKQQDSFVGSLSHEYEAALSGIASEESLAGQLGKAILARQLAFILAADEEWAKRNLVSFFTSESISDRQAVWHGFLYGRPGPQVAEIMKSPFLSALPSIGEIFSEDSDLRRQFVRFYASMAVYFVDDPIDDWIPALLGSVRPDDKEEFAWAMGDILASAEDVRRREWWDRWIRRYWENRLLGIPFPLETVEIQAMIGWLPKIGALFPEAMELAVRMEPAPFENSFIIHQLYQGDWWSMYPDATAKLVIWIAETNSPSWTWHEGKELITELLKCDLHEDLKDRLKEIPARLGWRAG